MTLLTLLAATGIGFSIQGLIGILIQLLVLVIIGWIIVWILRSLGAPELAIKIVYAIGGLIAILILLNLVYPFA